MNKKIIEIAKKYIGQTEKPNNSGFLDAEFEDKMREIGWQKGWAWCSCFVKLVCKEAEFPEYKLINPSVMKTWNAFKTNFPDRVVGKNLSNQIKAGDLFVMQSKTNKSKGHIGFVLSEIDGKGYFRTIEGNTDGTGSREGDGVCIKRRHINSGSLRLIGFIKTNNIL